LPYRLLKIPQHCSAEAVTESLKLPPLTTEGEVGGAVKGIDAFFVLPPSKLCSLIQGAIFHHFYSNLSGAERPESCSQFRPKISYGLVVFLILCILCLCEQGRQQPDGVLGGRR